jgi:hypothetical protein
MRWKFKNDESKRKEMETSDPPLHFADVPPHGDHSLLAYINSKSAALNLPPVFRQVTKPASSNNGEVFLTKCLVAELEREAADAKTSSPKASRTIKDKCCHCVDCNIFWHQSTVPNPPPVPNPPQPPTAIQNVPAQQIIPRTHNENQLPPMMINRQPPLPPRPFLQPIPLPRHVRLQGWHRRPDDCCFLVGPRLYCCV